MPNPSTPDARAGRKVIYRSSYGDVKAEIIRVTDKRVRLRVLEDAHAYHRGTEVHVLPRSVIMPASPLSPPDDGGDDETVTVSLRDPDLCIHRKHPRCETETPHAIASCGMFDHASSPPQPDSVEWWQAVARKLGSDHAVLAQRVKTLEEDKARLDWLLSELKLWPGAGMSSHVEMWMRGFCRAGDRLTREAIDAARALAEPTP